MDISDIERMTLGWNRHEINALKKYIEMRNKVKSLTDEQIREQRRYSLFLINRGSYVSMAPINPDEEYGCARLFDWNKLKYLEGIYEMIHVMDSMGSHDIDLYCLYDSMTQYIEECVREAEKNEEELEAGNSEEELEAENSEEELEAEEFLSDTEEDNGEPKKKIKLEEVQ